MLSPGMASYATDLLNLQQNRVAIAVQAHFAHAGRQFDPFTRAYRKNTVIFNNDDSVRNRIGGIYGVS